MKTNPFNSNATQMFLSALALLFVAAAPARAATAGITEPATTFYGKVLGTGDIQPFLITEGALTWTIRRADGVDVTLHASLHAYNKGTFSYRLDVPHSALSLGLAAGAANVPLALSEQTHRHASVTLDNESVTLLGPAGEVFTTAQLLRSATYRLDLGVARHALDTDGDGLPDWWEDHYGLDKQVNDANRILGNSGLTAAQAYALGLDPRADHTVPVLLTPETVVYAGGDTALILNAVDLDTAPSNLVYTVTSLPFGITALLASDGVLDPLETGSTFTHADVLAARVIYRHDREVSDPGLIGLALSDGQHEPVTGQVRLLLYEPAINEVSLRSDLYQLANAGFVVAEGDTINAAGAAVSYALAGVTLAGGDAADVIADVAEADTADRTWTGGAGADRFVITDFNARIITITDFSVAEGDMLDITVFAPASGTLSEHLTLSGGNTLVFATGARVVLNGLSDIDLYALVACGAVLTDLPLTPRVSVVATLPAASRNGPVAGEFTLTREGDISRALTVNVTVAGSAKNGTDYQGIPDSAVTFPAGVATLQIAVTPYTAGGNIAVAASMTVRAGDGYIVGSAKTASVTIAPRVTEVAVEAIVPVTARETSESGYFLVWRDNAGATLAVQNTLGGSAVRGADYQTINFDTGLAINPSLITFGANETEKLIEVAVAPSANLSGGAKTVSLAPVASTRYHVAPNAASAEVVLIERFDTFQDWLARNTSQMQLMSAEPRDLTKLYKFYAFGADVQGVDGSGFPHPFILPDGMTVRVKRPVGLTDVKYGIRGFKDLRDTVGTKVEVKEVDAPDGQPTGPEWRYYRFTDSNAPAGFISVDLH